MHINKYTLIPLMCSLSKYWIKSLTVCKQSTAFLILSSSENKQICTFLVIYSVMYILNLFSHIKKSCLNNGRFKIFNTLTLKHCVAFFS